MNEAKARGGLKCSMKRETGDRTSFSVHFNYSIFVCAQTFEQKFKIELIEKS